MAWPDDPLSLLVQVEIDGALETVSKPRGALSIIRGRTDEQSSVTHGRIDGLVVPNIDGRFTPRLPTSPWYGKTIRGTPVSVSVDEGPTYLVLPSGGSDVISTPDSASMSITGDLEVRVDSTTARIMRQNFYLASKWRAGSQKSWLLECDITGRIRWWWSADGSTNLSATSTVSLDSPSERIAVRVTHDVDDGAGGNVVRFWIARSMDGPWTELGDPVVGSGTTAVYDSTAPVEIGGVTNTTFMNPRGMLHGWQIWSGLATAGGTLVSGVDLSGATAGASTVSDGTRTWTLQGDTELRDVDVRGVAEIASIAPSWDITGTDATAALEVAGVMRRFATGASSLRSALYRSIIGQDPDAYWPCEDGKDATQVASAISGVGPMIIDSGSPLMSESESFAGSEPIIIMHDAQITGRLPAPYSATGRSAVQWVMNVDTSAGAPPTGQTIVAGFMAGGTIGRWELSYRAAGGLRLLIYSTFDTIVMDSGPYAFGIDDQSVFVQVALVDDGADIDWSIVTIAAGRTTGLAGSGTLVGHATGGARAIQLNGAGGLVDVAIGHVYVRSSDVTTQFDLGMSAGGWAGETAAARIVRLCSEEGIVADVRGAPDLTPTMGPQPTSTLLEALTECEIADGGLLYTPRRQIGIAYRTLTSMLHQQPGASIDYSAGQLAPPLEPRSDDQLARNDVTVRRVNGSLTRVVLDTGPMGTEPSPTGIGRYSEDVAVNVELDGQLEDIASWRLRQGTVDEARYSRIVVNLRSRRVTGSSLLDEIKSVDVGDVVEITSPPAQMPPDPIRIRVTSVTERITQISRSVELTGSPAAALETAIYQDAITFGDDFESGTLAAWPTVTGAAAASAAAAGAGTYGLRLSPSASAGAVATSTVKWAQTHVWAQAWMKFRINTLASGTSMDMVTIRNTAGSGHLDFFVGTSGKFQADLVGGSSDLDTGVIADVGVWHELQLRVFYGDTTWHAWLWLDGVVYGPIVQAGVTPAFVRSLHLGTTSAKTYEVDVDSIFIVVGDREPDSWVEECSRWDTAGSELGSGITSTAESLSVVTMSGPVWTTDEDDLPFDLGIGGERIRVRAVSGSTSPQTMTVHRAVNGVVKSHDAGAAISLWASSYYSIS